jgi:SAM-dependent methyltransferase
MHPEAMDGLDRKMKDVGLDRERRWRALDLGGRDINGSIRHLLPNAQWSGVDIEPGPGVDLVYDCTQPWPDTMPKFEVIVCTEVLEHVENWRALVRTCSQALEPDGYLFITCASTGRRPHGASGAMWPAPGEWYRNVSPAELSEVLGELFPSMGIEFRPNPGDLYAYATRVRDEG